MSPLYRSLFLQDSRGDSLVEVLVSMALISLIAMAVLPLLVGSRVLLRTGTQTSQGTTIAERDVTRVRTVFSSQVSTARENCENAIDDIITNVDDFPLSVSSDQAQYAGKFSIARDISSTDSESSPLELTSLANEMQNDATKAQAEAVVAAFCESVTPDPADSSMMSPRALSLRYTVTVTAPSATAGTSGSESSVTAARLSTSVLLLNSPS